MNCKRKYTCTHYIYNNFSTDYEFLDIPLNIHIIYYNINFTDENKYDNIACQIFYSNNYGQYQMTKILELPYYKGRDIYYNAMHFDPISSLFDFYAYIFIANECTRKALLEYLTKQVYK